MKSLTHSNQTDCFVFRVHYSKAIIHINVPVDEICCITSDIPFKEVSAMLRCILCTSRGWSSTKQIHDPSKVTGVTLTCIVSLPPQESEMVPVLRLYSNMKKKKTFPQCHRKMLCWLSWIYTRYQIAANAISKLRLHIPHCNQRPPSPLLASYSGILHAARGTRHDHLFLAACIGVSSDAWVLRAKWQRASWTLLPLPSGTGVIILPFTPHPSIAFTAYGSGDSSNSNSI